MKRESPSDDRSGVDDRIDERCDALEAAWRKGDRPNIGDFIGLEDDSYRNKLFRELLLVELESRRVLGEQPAAEHYRQEFPEFASEVDAVELRQGATVFSTIHAKGASAARAESRQPGSRVAHFELIGRLGAGAMGEAWKAWDTHVKRHVTIKLPHCNSLSESDLHRFLREVEAAGQLNHPQLAAVHSIEKDGTNWFIVAAFVEGDNLRDYATKKLLTYDEAVNICARIGEALQHAHDEGVVHRDLKPANIIIDSNGLPHVIDFGLAKILDAEHDLTLNGELLGTPAYMSPELARGEGAKADARTDVYSLGVILYELLAGRCPFEGSHGSVIGHILTRDPPPPRSLLATIPRDLETICLKAMEKSPEKRYATATAMTEDLRRFSVGLPIRARRVGILEKVWRWTRRHPAMATSALLLAAAIVGASTTIASLQNQNKHLAGFRPARITTTPSGARVALVPLDPNTNEPDSDPTKVVRPPGTTPLTTELKAGTYLVEAALPSGESWEFVEVYRTVLESSRVRASLARANMKSGLAPDTCLFPDIKIVSVNESIKKMVLVQIPEDVRKRNPLLPAQLYVDEKQTTPAALMESPRFKQLLRVREDGSPYIRYGTATKWAEANQARLASAAEYEAMADAVERGEARSVETGAIVTLDDLFDDFPEFSTTTKTNLNVDGNTAVRELRDMHVLKGFKALSGTSRLLPWAEGDSLAGPDAESPKISIRGVRSATPRFVKP